jgi:hypothetical protein
MSTKSTIWLGTDESGRNCHLYWEVRERIPGKAAPIFMSIEARGKEAAIRLPKEVGEKIRDILEPDNRILHCIGAPDRLDRAPMERSTIAPRKKQQGHRR